ncbi:MAG TPA: hypothetical protein VK028_16420 [Micromonosporaceae bacterium]|nr:hypothetical protein [Micromonosporaceae bacterium]
MTPLDAPAVAAQVPSRAAQAPSPAARLMGDLSGPYRLGWRVLRQHWPALLAIALAAQIARDGVLEVATRVLAAHGWFWFFLVFALAPTATMTAWVVMLRRARSSLPGLAATPPGALVAVIVPFVAYYQLALAAADWQTVSGGLLSELLGRQFAGLRLAATDFVPVTVAAAVVAVLVLLRWLSSRRVNVYPAAGIPALYVEILLFLFLGSLTVDAFSRSQAWVEQRRVWVDAVAIYHSTFDWAGPAAGAAQGARDWWTGAWQVVTPALVVPIFALVAGAVALGLRPPEQPRPRHRAGNLAWATVLALVDLLRGYLLSRIGIMLQVLRVMLRAGLVAALSFCVGFVALDVATDWLLPLERTLIGPHDFSDFWIPVSALLARVNNAIWTLLLICLLAGTVGHVARRLDAAALSASSGEQPHESGPLPVEFDADGGRVSAGR